MLLAIGTETFPARGYGLPRAADALYFARPLDDLHVLARREGLSHLLVRTSNLRGSTSGLRRLFNVGDYIVFARED
jgi:hypothetical protein